MFCVIIVKTQLHSLNDCTQWDRPGNEDTTRCQNRKHVLHTRYPS